MMDEKILLWIRELKRYNSLLHLVGSGMISTIRQDVEEMLPLLERISEPVIADIGSGSGLPAIPFKILHPASRVVLIERSSKKCTFLRHTLDLMGMQAVEILEADPLVEDIGMFDAVLSRSFSPLSTLGKTVLRILAQQGRFYYLFTGNKLPDLDPRLRLMELFTRNCPGYTLSLAVFRLTPR